jgi:outer membrane lipoprotein-sorting protein
MISHRRNLPLAFLLSISLASFAGAAPQESPPDAEALLERTGDTWGPLEAALTATMTTEQPDREPSVMDLRILRGGRGRTRIDFLSPEKQRGKAILQLEGETWMYLPRADRVVEVPQRRNPLSGSMLFEDLFPGGLEAADVTVEEDEDGYVLVSSGADAKRKKKRGTDRIHFRRETLLPFRREFYGASGRLLKTVHIEETREWNGVSLPWKVRFVDHLRKGTEVTIEIQEATNLEDPGNLFTREGLAPAPEASPEDD